jgi:hypothetical protein
LCVKGPAAQECCKDRDHAQPVTHTERAS